MTAWGIVVALKAMLPPPDRDGDGDGDEHVRNAASAVIGARSGVVGYSQLLYPPYLHVGIDPIYIIVTYHTHLFTEC